MLSAELAMTNSGAWFWMKLLHLQQIPVVAHTTHNRLNQSNPTQPDLTPLYPTPNLSIHHPPSTTQTPPHTILFTSPPKHSIHLSFHLYTSTYTDAYTLTRLIVNKLLTLYIYIDILTFMWYNKDNGKGPFYMLNI